MRLSFKNKIFLGVISLLLAFGCGIYIAASKILREALLEENRSRGLLIASNLAARAAEPILAADFLRLKNLVDEAVRLDDDLHYAFILNTRKEILAHTFKGGFPTELTEANSVPDSEQYHVQLLDAGGELITDYAVPVFVGEDRFATVRLGLGQTSVRQAIDRLSLTMLLATALFLGLLGLIGGGLARNVGKRIETLHRSIERVMRGDLEVQTALSIKKNCWDVMHCDKQECPAYNEHYSRCWYLAGTLCPTCVEGEYAKKIASCAKCPVYKSCSGDEIQKLADSFDCMVRTLKNRVSELKSAEQNLMEQQRLLKMILDATPDFVSLQDRNSVYIVVNKAFCGIVGRDESEIIGKTDFQLFPPERAKSNREEDLAVIQSGEPLTKEEKITLSKGERWIHLVKLPVRDSSGVTVGLLCSGRDITELKAFQERFMQTQKLEAVGRLTAGIAHEINTPLGIILGYVQLLLEEVEPDSQIHADLKTVEKHAKISRKIVSDLLGFSRHTESRMAPFDVNRAIEDVLSVVEHTFRLERIEVIRELDQGIPNLVGDQEKIKQAIVNLLNNAFDAIGTDGFIVVSTSWDETNDEVLVAVADTGKGIPPEDMDRIFDPFFTTKEVGKGTGLGLSVTFGIVEEHGGRIEVESPLPAVRAKAVEALREQGRNPLKGSVLTLRLPVRRSIPENQEEVADG